MGTQNYFIMDAADRVTAMGLDDDEEASVMPLPVNTANPGVGINLNDSATGFDPGDPVALSSMYVAPVRIVNDPAYITYAPGLVTFLNGLPFALLENETIFMPPEEI